MNMMAPDLGKGVPSSPHPDTNRIAAKSLGTRGQTLSLYVGILFVALSFLSSLWIASHRRFWYDEIFTMLIARLPDSATIWRALASAVTARPWSVEPPSNGGGTARLRDALEWESIVAKDGKKSIAVPADLLIGVEARYYSKHPERYAFVVTPRMKVVARVHRNIAQYQPMRFWTLEDLRAAARDTALLEPNDEMLKAMTGAGFQIKHLASDQIKMVYLE
jgi:hypothetical protein